MIMGRNISTSVETAIIEETAQPRVEIHQEIYRRRLESYVLAIASGWYGAPQGVQHGENESVEAPRAVPELTAGLIVDAAIALMHEVDCEVADPTVLGKIFTPTPQQAEEAANWGKAVK